MAAGGDGQTLTLLGAFVHPDADRNTCAVRVCHDQCACFVVVLYRGVRVLSLCRAHADAVCCALMSTSTRLSLAIELPPERVARIEMADVELEKRTHWETLERETERAVFDFNPSFGFAHAHARRKGL